MDIFPDHRKFLAFSWHFGTNCVRYFQFTVLPFGLSSAPFIFTKLILLMVSALVLLVILRNLTGLSSAQVSFNPVF